ncbi:glycosyltransferase family 87 protein [Pedobacter sp. ASV12]|uniref:glycosyltransferase family 87 protein n=1 Tax=Pedobacter sp. ASV12 TaxID=2795120 RepID=UPI0018EB4395
MTKSLMQSNLRLKASLCNLFNNQNFIFAIWVALALAVSIKQAFQPTNNNYLIFKYVYLHAVERLPLYDFYFNQYQDSNHYGPFFSLVIAPFAQLPDYLGMLLWQLANIGFLFFAISQLPIGKNKVNLVFWIITHELLTAMFGLQFNISITAIIVLAYVFIVQGKNFWAAFVIMLGTFVKLYGIVGLAFFFFAKQKPKFILYCIFWAIVMFVAPMLFFSPAYILQCYHDWFVSLSEKQHLNASLNSMQDISVMGMARRISGHASLPNLPFILGGLFLFGLPYLRIKYYKNEVFRLLILASTLIFAVIFSNSSESPTYIVAFTGVAVWFVIQERPLKPIVIILFIFAFVLTSLSPSDLFPRYLKETYVKPYSLKALPCILIWLAIIYQLIVEKFKLKPIQHTHE